MITKAEIQDDIKSFESRISEAKDKLNTLPQTGGTWKDRAKLKVERRALNDNIQHLNKLIGIAKDGLLDF